MPENFFTRQSFGGVPNYVWLGAGGVAVIFIVRRQGQQKAQPGLTQAQQQQLAMQQQEAALQAQMAQGQMPTYGSSGAPIYVLPQTSPGVSTPGTPPSTTPAATPTAGAFYGEGYAGSASAPGAVTYSAPWAAGGSITTAPVTYQGQTYSPVTQPAYSQWEAASGIAPVNTGGGWENALYPAQGLYYQPSPGVIAPAPSYVPADTPLFSLGGSPPGIV